MSEKKRGSLQRKDTSGLWSISGKFNLTSYDNGIIIQFIEDFYSGYNSELKLLYSDGQEKILNSYRTSKTIISSNILNFKHLDLVEKIILTYDFFITEKVPDKNEFN